MNRINPEKLMRSKWTALNPVRREKHFIVTRLIRDEHEAIAACTMEAVINHHSYQVNWTLLRDDTQWLMGWK